MADGCADLQQEARLRFTISVETRSVYPPGLCSALRGSAAVRSLCNGCQLACGGYKHEAKGREHPVLSGPQRPPRGVEVWRTSVLGTACVSVFSVCLRGHLYANVKQAIGLANYSGAFVCARQ